MIHQGRLVTQAPVAELMKPLNEFEIVFEMASGVDVPPAVARLIPRRDGNRLIVAINDVEVYSSCIQELAQAGATIHHTASKTRSLEEYFIDLVQKTSAASA
jgi:hypothetical protein